MSAAIPLDPQPFDEARWAHALVTRICALGPRRVAGSEDERRAHELVAGEMTALGLDLETLPFEWNRSAYANMALHFGLGVLGSVVAPFSSLAGLALHGIAAGSYTADSARAGFLLRDLFPKVRSQNVLGVMKAKGTPRLRIVFLAHVDAAFTGMLFRPEFLARFGSKQGGPFAKSLRLATAATAGNALLDVWQLLRGRSLGLNVLRALLTLPAFAAFALNLDVVLRDRVVPGAMDDLSGVAGMLLLAKRLRGRVPEDVEVVFVATGCEEASLGGAQALATARRNAWDPTNTVIVGLDGLANGELCWFTEGEVLPVALAPWLRDTLCEVAASEPRFSEVAPFDIPVGATDAVPFAAKGYAAVTLGCVERARGVPRHYHLPTDTPENLDASKIPFCVDFAERLFDAIVARR